MQWIEEVNKDVKDGKAFGDLCGMDIKSQLKHEVISNSYHGTKT
jgi:hypothetical protein